MSIETIPARKQKVTNTKGHARIALRGQGAYLQERLRQFVTLPKISSDLAEQNIEVSVTALRKWMMEFLPNEYAEYLQITGRGRKKNRTGGVAAPAVEMASGSVMVAAKESLSALLERKKMEDLALPSGCKSNRTKRLLQPRMAELREMVVYGLSLREINAILTKADVQVNYHTLRGFLKNNLPQEFEQYLASKKPGGHTVISDSAPREAGEPAMQDGIAAEHILDSEQSSIKTAALKSRLDRKKAEAEAGVKPNVRGSVTKLLMPRIEILREASRLGTPITQQLEMLEAAGISVSYNSLRKFIQKRLSAEYQVSLANSRTTGDAIDRSEILAAEVTVKSGAAIEEWLAKEKETDARNLRGAGFRRLNPVKDQITLLMQHGKTIKDIHRALDEALGIQVDLKTVRKYMLDHMAEESGLHSGPTSRGKREAQSPVSAGPESAAKSTSQHLDDLIALAEQDMKASLNKGKGSARIKLEGYREPIAKMLLKKFTAQMICDVLEKDGTKVNIKSLYKFIREEMNADLA